MTHQRYRSFVAALGAVALLAACGPSPEEVARQEAMKKLDQAAKEMEAAGKRAEAAAAKGDVGAAMGEAMKALGGLAGAAGGFDPVDFRKLKEVLPQELPGELEGPDHPGRLPVPVDPLQRRPVLPLGRHQLANGTPLRHAPSLRSSP